jgi:hypothetical protein
MKKFNELKFNRSMSIEKEGMEISAYLAGVNSGAYSMPFVISVRTWARKWFFKKFFYREMYLNIFEVKELKEECERVIEFWEQEKKKSEED